jgi:hypothetical protein
MTLDEILVILQNRLINLDNARKAAVAAGSLDQVGNIDSDIVSTTSSIQQIKNTLGVT